jgi:hypothetical protein
MILDFDRLIGWGAMQEQQSRCVALWENVELREAQLTHSFKVAAP